MKVYIKSIVILLICSAFAAKAQMPEKYTGVWYISPYISTFDEYKTTLIDGMKAMPQRFGKKLEEYNKDTAAYINNLRADYDSLSKHTIEFTVSIYTYRYYDNFYKEWRTVSNVYNYNATTQELLLANSCGGFSHKLKLAELSKTPLTISLEEIFTGTYDIGYTCFPGSCVLKKKD